MRCYVSLSCIALICLAGLTNGQQVEQKEKYAAVPSEQALITVVHQQDCPLQFEEAKCLISLDGHLVPSYYLRNQGAKPIRSFTVGSPGSTWTWSYEASGKLMVPGQRVPDLEENSEIVPLTKELRDKLKLHGPMKTLIVLMVIRVEYADGSMYNAESAFSSMEMYLSDLADKANETEWRRKQKILSRVSP